MGLICISLSVGKRLKHYVQHILQCDCVPFVKHKTGISADVLLQQRHNTETVKMEKVSEIL